MMVATGIVLADAAPPVQPSAGIAFTALFPASDESSYITGTDIVVDAGWFSSAPYLANERSHHMLQLLDANDKAEGLMDAFLKHFR